METIQLLIHSYPLLLEGAYTTLKLWACTATISLVLGTLFGLARASQLQIPLLSPALDVLTFLLRGIPFFVQLMLVYFVLPDLLNINLSPFVAGVVSLGLCSAAYVSQMVRGGINSIDSGQWEAAFCLGYSKLQTVRYVILPQAFARLLPALCSEIDQLLKSTAIISTIGVLDLTFAGQNLVTTSMKPIPIYLGVAAIYLLFSTIIVVIGWQCERNAQ